jgi:hypothetical protein
VARTRSCGCGSQACSWTTNSLPGLPSPRAALALALDGAAADGVRVLLGRALYEMGRLREAREAFLVAQQDPASQAAVAQWLSFLDTEIARPRSGNPKANP